MFCTARNPQPIFASTSASIHQPATTAAVISDTSKNNSAKSPLNIAIRPGKNFRLSKNHPTNIHLATVVQADPVQIVAPESAVLAGKSRGLVMFAVGLFIVGAALAAAETAITTLWPWKVRELAEKEGPSSPFSILNSDLTRFLTTILVTTTASTVFSTAIATDLAGQVLRPAVMAYFTAGMTIFFLFFGEILPKALAVHSPAKVARVMVPFIGMLSKIVFPVGQLLAWVSQFLLKMFKIPGERDGDVSEEELRLIVAGADRSGSIEKYEREIIQNVLDLEQKDVREVMSPRVNIIACSTEDTLSHFMELERNSRYSRMPVYDGNIDNIVGFVYAKSLLRYLTLDSSLLETTLVEEIMDAPFFVMESMSAWSVLEEMRKKRLHLAIVVDEYGGTAGLVTLEDILEEVVGEILDEDDDDEAAAVDMIESSDGRIRIEGSAELDKVLEKLDVKLEEDTDDDYETLSGLLCTVMGGIPQVGDEVVIGKWRFEIREADDRKILNVMATPLTQDELAENNGVQVSEEENTDASNGEESPLRKLINLGNGNGAVNGGTTNGEEIITDEGEMKEEKKMRKRKGGRSGTDDE